MARAILACALAASLVGCGGASPTSTRRPAAPAPQVEVLAKYEVLSHPFPAATPPASFAVTKTGMVLVPMAGGVYVAGWRGWLIEPQSPPVIAVAAVDDGMILATATDSEVVLARWHAGAPAVPFGTLPAGMYQLTTTPQGALWISGREATGAWALYFAPKGAGPQRIAELPVPIMSVASANESGAVLAVGNDLLLVRRSQETVRLARTKDPIEGVAVEARGTVVFTTRLGMYRLDAPGHVNVLATGLHGPLIIRGNRIYVMRHDRKDVLALTPPAGVAQ